jgi:tetratricopeptide (TPR) repeat protein
LSRRERAHLEAKAAREIFEGGGGEELDDLASRLAAADLQLPSPLQQRLIERLQSRRAAAAAAAAGAGAGAAAGEEEGGWSAASITAAGEQIVAACRKLLRAEPTSMYALRTLLEMGEEDSRLLSPGELRKLACRAAHSFPTRCDGWAALADSVMAPKADPRASTLAALLSDSDGCQSVQRYLMQAQLAPANDALRFLRSGSSCIGIRRTKTGAQLNIMQQELQLLSAECHAQVGQHIEALREFGDVQQAAELLCNQRAARGVVASALALAQRTPPSDEQLEHLSLASSALESLVGDAEEDKWCLLKYAELHSLRRDFERGERLLLRTVSRVAPKDAQAHLQLARLYWQWGEELPKYRQDKKYCHRRLLLAVKHDPSHAPTFVLLAELLHTQVGDTAKAHRCLAKAVSLDPSDTRAAQMLAQHLMNASLYSELEALCVQVLDADAACKWAWQRLGVAQQKQGDLASSIISLQRAVRCDQSDVSSWQELANSYYLQGKYACSTKVLAKILTLPAAHGQITAMYRKARLHLLLGELDEAIAGFEELMVSVPNWSPALLGMGDSLLRKSLAQYSSGWFRLSLTSLTEAVRLVQICAQQQQGLPQLLSAWKLLGDGLLNFSLFSPEDCKRICTTVQLPPTDETVDSKSRLMQEASRVYSRLVFMDPASAAKWHDLGVCVHEHVKLGGTDSSTAAGLISTAIRLEPCNAEWWNSLGCVHMDPAVSQHAFIRAIQLDDKYVAAWNSLGSLYMQHGKIDLAHRAFSESKRLNPSSPASWTGLARSLELRGHLQDAKFTYGQSLQLNPSQPEALLGFGNCVAKLLAGDGADSNDVHAALAHVSQYLVLNPEDPHGHNLRGIFLYELQLERSSVTSFTCALQMLQRVDIDSSDEAIRVCQLNLAHALSCCGEYASAERYYRKVGATSTHPAVSLALGWTLAMQGRLGESTAVYEGLLGQDTSSRICAEFGRLCVALGDERTAQRFLGSRFASSCTSAKVRLILLRL